jgi:hypothetical protein
LEGKTDNPQREAEDQVRAALEAMQGTALRLLQEGETHPQLLVLSVAMAAGQLAAATALAGGQDVEEALGELAEVMVQSGRDHHEMLRAELLPVAGNA